MSKKEAIEIPGAKKYAISEDGTVTNVKSGTPVFPKAGKVNLYADDGTRKPFEVAALLKDLHGVEVAAETKKEKAPKAEKVKKEAAPKKAAKKAAGDAPVRGTIITEIQALFAKGKTKEQVLALDKYNKSTVNVQWGKFKKANEK